MTEQIPNSSWPSVSIIVAARNEEGVIERLLESLITLTYPRERIQIIMGDDDSTDSTPAILEAWQPRLPDCRIIRITEQVPGLTGKGNVLAQLCRHATGGIYLFTDADCTVPPRWVEGMIEPFLKDPKLGILTGVTIPFYHAPFEKVQAVDWIAAQCVIWFLSLLRIPVTAMGNNMAISASAYRASGGFETTPGGITEDYAIFHHINDQGIGWGNRFDVGVLARTLPMPTVRPWLEQRLRWFSGAMKLAWHTQLPFWFQMLLYPLLLVFGLMAGWKAAFLIWAMKFFFQTMMFVMAAIRLGQFRLAFWTIVYEPWSVWACWTLWLNWRKSPVITWKGREFEKSHA